VNIPFDLTRDSGAKAESPVSESTREKLAKYTPEKES
jgi:hypothetical protein